MRNLSALISLNLFFCSALLALSVSAADEVRTEKRHPQIRVIPSSQAKVTIPNETIYPYIKNVTLLQPAEISNAPYILGFAGQVSSLGAGVKTLSSLGDIAYVQNIQDEKVALYYVVEPMRPIRDPKNSFQILAYLAAIKGTVERQTTDIPASYRVIEANQEIKVGDQLIPVFHRPMYDFHPHYGKHDLQTAIVDVFGDQNYVGKGHVVVLQVGSEDGVEVGELLQVYRPGAVNQDQFAQGLLTPSVRLPDEPMGEIMVYKLMQRLSLAVVLENKDFIQKQDIVRSH